MLARLLVLLCASCVGFALAESRFLQSSLNAETVHASTSIAKEWSDFWEYMHTNHHDLRLNFAQRQFRGVGRSGAAFYVPSTDSGTPGKLLKVWIMGHEHQPMKTKKSHVSNIKSAQKSISKALKSYAESGTPQANWAEHFVKRKCIFAVPRDHINGYFFEVMEEVQGMTLKEYISSAAMDRSAAHLRGLVRQLLEVLYVMNRIQMVHGDLHPDNIIIRPDGRLVVIDMADAATCHDDSSRTAKMIYTPYDSVPENRKAEGQFTVIDDDTCIAFDAYSIGVNIISLARRTVIPDHHQTLPFYYLNVALAALNKLDLEIQHLSSNVPTSHGHSSDPVLKRILVALLDPHRAPRTVATLALLDRVLLKELGSISEDELQYTVTASSAGLLRNPEDYSAAVEVEDEEGEEEEEAAADGYGYSSESKKKKKKKKTTQSTETKPKYPLQGEDDIFGVVGKKIDDNGLTKFMPEAAATSFPPGVAIVARPQEEDVHRSYIPNILFRNGLHAHPFPTDTDKSIQAAVLYNIFELQLVYRHKLVLQFARETHCLFDHVSHRETRDTPFVVSVDQQVPTEDGKDTKTVFEFAGQETSLQAILNLLEHPVDGKYVHASVLNWDNHVVAGGCIEKDGTTESSTSRYVFRGFRGALHHTRMDTGIAPTHHFFTVERANAALQLHVPRMLVVGGGPMGLIAALEGKKSAAAVTIWEKRSKYTRMHCQQCSVSHVIQRFHLTTATYLKSVEETLAAVAITVGINLQFLREILYLDQGAAVGRVADGTWAATPGTTWAELKEQMMGSDNLITLSVHVVVGADGSGSALRKHALNSGFEDAKQVVLDGQGTVYNTRVLKPKPTGSAIYSLATLQFFNHGCRYSRSNCIRHDTGFDQIWALQDDSHAPLCFVEYIEKYNGLQHIEQDILARNGLHTFSSHGVDAWQLMKRHEKSGEQTAGEKAALRAFDELLLARYLTVDVDKPEVLNKLGVQNVAGERCALTEPPVADAMLNTFREQRDARLLSTFWLRTRRVDAEKFAGVTDGVTVVLVGDATRDSFFPMGNGLARHISVLTAPLAGSAFTDIQKSSVLGSLLRSKIGVSDYNRHFEKDIQNYIHHSSSALLATVACTNVPVANEGAADVRVRNVNLLHTLSKMEAEAQCPGLTVEDA